MAYVDRIQSLKDAISGYSAEEKRLTELYKTAREKSEEAKKQSLSLLDASYKSDRNEAFADNARDERNTMRVLASRGLGFSGEAAQARLNSDLALSSRLGELASENSKNRQDIINKSDNHALSLSIDEAHKLSDIASDKSKLLADLTKTQAELDAKYDNSLDIDINGSGGNGNNGTAETPEGNKENEFFDPDIKPKELAKLAVLNATGGEFVKTEEDARRLNKYLFDLYESHALSDDYKEELVFMLKAYGYKALSEEELKHSVITNEATLLYDSAYTASYKAFVDRGVSPSSALVFAANSATNEVMDMLYDHSDSKEEFLKLCKALKIKDEVAKSYAEDENRFVKKIDYPDRIVNVKRPNNEGTK
jgi:hypothetical protein